MEINFFTYLDNNGDGTGGIADTTLHRIALTDQGTFGGTAISSANHKVLVFAEPLLLLRDAALPKTRYGMHIGRHS